MGLMDEIRKLTHPYSEQEDDYDELEDELPAEEEAPAPRRTFSRSNAPAPAETPRTSGVGRVVNINSGAQLQVVLVKTDRYDKVSEIADHLRDKKAIVLNLEDANKDSARRLVDFLSGCAYALDGKIKKVAAYTYLITPYHVGIIDEVVEELENSGAYF